ncbi:AraC family transcriptional regulator [Enterobacter sp.]|uniref:AraC family transcriptional regulator n=1 Tax=Enterobacter sp. TaxID=42895 RepID=UPI002981E62F|nr:AraC family transcriptional regulator [Enterobacter sp.]
MDSLSRVLTLLAPASVVNLHCRFAGRWTADHAQLAPGVVPWHVILHGSAQLQLAGKTLNVNAGDVLLLPHGSPHILQGLVEWGQVAPVAKHFNGTLTEVRTEGEGDSVDVLCGEFHFGANSGWLFAKESGVIHLRTRDRQDCPELELLLTMLVRESLSGSPGGTTIVDNLTATFLVLVLRILLTESEPPAGLLRLLTDKRLAPAVLAVLADPSQPWTMESMAGRCFLSRATFARHFARCYHQTPQAWLTQLRMALAARLLIQERSQTVDAIAARCGFLSLASFSKAFQRHYELTPAHYRKTRAGIVA